MTRAATALAALSALAACSVSVGMPGAGGPPAFEPVSSPGQFLDAVAGKPITFDNGVTMVANPDGTIGGEMDGVDLTGAWEFVNGQLCRTITAGTQEFPQVCNLLEVTPDGIRFLNPDGTLSSEAVLG